MLRENIFKISESRKKFLLRKIAESIRRKRGGN